ncbi:hypothetical protein D3C71_1050270 [compost metagenome]
MIGCHRLSVKLLDGGFQPVGHLTQAHGTCQARTSLEGVQRTQHFTAGTKVVGTRGPLAQRTTKLWQQLGSLFLKDREQIRVDNVNRIDIVVHIRAKRHSMGDRIINTLIVVVDDGRQSRGHMPFGAHNSRRLRHGLQVRLGFGRWQWLHHFCFHRSSLVLHRQQLVCSLLFRR